MKARPKTCIEKREPPFSDGKPIYLARVWEKNLQIWITVGIGSTHERAKEQLEAYFKGTDSPE